MPTNHVAINTVSPLYLTCFRCVHTYRYRPLSWPKLIIERVLGLKRHSVRLCNYSWPNHEPYAGAIPAIYSGPYGGMKIYGAAFVVLPLSRVSKSISFAHRLSSADALESSFASKSKSRVKNIFARALIAFIVYILDHLE
jgi:hypothetical protein